MSPTTRLFPAALALTLLTGFSSLVGGCRSASKAPEAAPTPIPLITVNVGGQKQPGMVARQLTIAGENSEPRFSPDGSKVIFSSRARISHRQAQIYELDLAKMLERRLTFHDGDDSSPMYSLDGARFLYASSTDEIKEEPEAIERLMRSYYPEKSKKGAKAEETLPVAELYSQPFGSEAVERMTRSPGFDGEADLDRKGKRMAFVTTRHGMPQIYLLTGSEVRRVTMGKDNGRGPRFSPDGRSLAFARFESTTGATNLHLAEGDFTKAQPLTSGTSIDQQPSWHPSGEEIVFSSNRGGKTFNLYVIDRRRTCMRRVTTAEFDQTSPAFSPDGKKLLFVGRVEGRPQIYLMDYQPTAECISPGAAALEARPKTNS